MMSKSSRPAAIVPAFDPELVPALRILQEALGPLTAETLAARRTIIAEWPARQPALDLTAGGRICLEDRMVPGPIGAPDVSVLILRPVDVVGPLPAIYFIHGGGMVLGTNRLGVD